MSRIRSIHPGIWTDEAFVTLSPMARLFLMGLWNECDDAGSFAWSPLGLKMRILPADPVDGAELLAECVEAGMLLRYEVAGKAYGAVRNFCQFQRPKKPNAIHPQTEQVREWVNLAAREKRDGSEPVPHQSETDGEKPRQMEDGGGRMDNNSVSNETVVPEPQNDDEPVKPEHVVEAWNAMADTCGLPKARMTESRRAKLKTFVKKNTVDDITEAIWRVPKSDFLCGRNGRDWKADLDFLLTPSKFPKILEGSYG